MVHDTKEEKPCERDGNSFKTFSSVLHEKFLNQLQKGSIFIIDPKSEYQIIAP